jgi:hypothetical protein
MLSAGPSMNAVHAFALGQKSRGRRAGTARLTRRLRTIEAKHEANMRVLAAAIVSTALAGAALAQTDARGVACPEGAQNGVYGTRQSDAFASSRSVIRMRGIAAQLANAPVETPDGVRLGTIKRIYVAVSGTPMRIMMVMPDGTTAVLKADQMRFSPAEDTAFTRLSPCQIRQLPAEFNP